jgi:RNA polymerase sigma-70 factor, ECF subfamily
VRGHLAEDQHTLDAFVVRLAEGDRSAFTPVFELLWPRVHALCLSLLRQPHDADDAAQQAMEKILTRASGYDRTRSALPWALAIAAWECRTLRRRAGRRREVSEDALSEVELAASLEDDFVRRELESIAVDVLKDLSPEDRSVLMAAYWEEARATATPAARKRRQRALARLRTAFRRLYDPD